MNLLIESDRQTDIFSRYPQLHSLLDVKIISVDTNWRGMGICKALLEKTRYASEPNPNAFAFIKFSLAPLL